MTELQNQAVKKIDEAGEKIPGSKAFAEYIIQKLIKTDAAAQKILDGDFKKLIENIKSRARKEAEGNCAVIPDFEVYEWINEFYKLTDSDLQATETQKVADILAFDPFAGLI